MKVATVKKHTRTRKNGASTVKQHTRGAKGKAGLAGKKKLAPNKPKPPISADAWKHVQGLDKSKLPGAMRHKDEHVRRAASLAMRGKSPAPSSNMPAPAKNEGSI